MLFSMSGCTLVWVGMTAASAAYAASGAKILADGTAVPGTNGAAGKTVLGFIFIFGAGKLLSMHLDMRSNG